MEFVNIIMKVKQINRHVRQNQIIHLIKVIFKYYFQNDTKYFMLYINT